MRYLIARLRARLGRAGQPEPSRPVERSAADIADQHHADATAAAELAAIRDQLDQIQPLVRGLHSHARRRASSEDRQLSARAEKAQNAGLFGAICANYMVGLSIGDVPVLFLTWLLIATLTTIGAWLWKLRRTFSTWQAVIALGSQYGATLLGAKLGSDADHIPGTVTPEIMYFVLGALTVYTLAVWAVIFVRKRQPSEAVPPAPVMPGVIAGLAFGILFLSLSAQLVDAEIHNYTELHDGGAFVLVSDPNTEVAVVLGPKSKRGIVDSFDFWELTIAFTSNDREPLAGSWALVASGNMEIRSAKIGEPNVLSSGDIDLDISKTESVLPYRGGTIGTVHTGPSVGYQMPLNWYSEDNNQVVSGRFSEDDYTTSIVVDVEFAHPIVRSGAGIIDGSLPAVGCPYDLWSDTAEDTGAFPPRMLRGVPSATRFLPSRCTSELNILTLNNGLRMIQSSADPSSGGRANWVFMADRPALRPKAPRPEPVVNPDGSTTIDVSGYAFTGFRERGAAVFDLSAQPVSFEIESAGELERRSNMRFRAGVFAGLAGSSFVWAAQTFLAGWPKGRRGLRN